MPDITGIDCSKMIREASLNDPDYFNPYIIICSGFSKSEIQYK